MKPSPNLPLAKNAQILIQARAKKFLSEFEQACNKLSPARVHDLRVASRRMRECLLAFHSILPAKGYGRPIRMARSLTRLLGETRNQDVMQHLFAQIASQHPQSPEGKAARGWSRRLAIQALACREQLSGRIHHFDADRFQEKIARLLHRIQKLPPPDAHPSTPQILKMGVSPRLKAMAVVKKKAMISGSAAERHRLRIAIKKLRYRLETLAFLFGKPAKEEIENLTRHQDLLGEMHDLEVALQWLRNAADQAARRTAGRASPHSALKALLAKRHAALYRKFKRQCSKLQPALIKQSLCKNLRN